MLDVWEYIPLGKILDLLSIFFLNNSAIKSVHVDGLLCDKTVPAYHNRRSHNIIGNRNKTKSYFALNKNYRNILKYF